MSSLDLQISGLAYDYVVSEHIQNGGSELTRATKAGRLEAQTVHAAPATAMATLALSRQLGQLLEEIHGLRKVSAHQAEFTEAMLKHLTLQTRIMHATAEANGITLEG